MELKNKSLFKEECYIGGKWIKRLNDETINVDNTATKKKAAKYPEPIYKKLRFLLICLIIIKRPF